MGRCTWFDRKGRRCLRSFHLFGVHSYEPLAKVGHKAAREAVELGLFREAVRENAGGVCQAWGLYRPDGGTICGRTAHAGEHAHHLFPEDRDVGQHDPDRGLWVCWLAHDWLHSNPAAAHVLGLLRPDMDTAS